MLAWFFVFHDSVAKFLVTCCANRVSWRGSGWMEAAKRIVVILVTIVPFPKAAAETSDYVRLCQYMSFLTIVGPCSSKFFFGGQCAKQSVFFQSVQTHIFKHIGTCEPMNYESYVCGHDHLANWCCLQVNDSLFEAILLSSGDLANSKKLMVDLKLMWSLTRSIASHGCCYRKAGAIT